jgi:hypothetical protein
MSVAKSPRPTTVEDMELQPTLTPTSGLVLAAMVTTPAPATMRAQAHRLDIPDDVAYAAVQALTRQEVTGAVITGKMASGKDTVADALVATAHSRGLTAQVHRTSDPIRAELNQAIGIISRAGSPVLAVQELTGQMNLPDDVAEVLAARLFASTREVAEVAEARTNQNRFLLQYIADEGRRRNDPDYWVRVCFGRIYAALAKKTSVLLSGGRYPNEVFPAQTLGLVSVRIEVTLETQLARLRARDGIEPDLDLIFSPNECALDSYVGFNIKLTNDGALEPTVAAIDATLRHHSNALS